jgi:PKD repeat protein
MRRLVLIALIYFLANSRVQAQCNPNFNDTILTTCGVVTYTNLSTPNSSLVSYSWNFPSGSPATSTLTNPTITYTANGNYTACLFMVSVVPSCSATICKTITVNCFTTTCTANFTPSLCVGGTMQFVNTSPGTNSTTVYDWDFGNSTTSSLTNPTATYNANGIYTVCLSYTTTAPAYCTATICKTVNITCVTNSCSASFNTVSCTPSGTNAQVSFTNTSSGTNSATAYSWSFGNNTTSTVQNPPPVTYTANGVYVICLSINTPSPPCIDSICQTITVSCVPTPTTGPCQANFTNTPCTNGQVTFYSISTGTLPSTTYTWVGGSPPNTASVSGSYTTNVCLYISHAGPPSCNHHVCKTVTVDCAVGIPEFIFDTGNIRIFPNPGSGLFTLDLNQANLNSPSYDVKVYNILGELVHQSFKEIDQGKLHEELDLQNLPSGAYYLRLNSGHTSYSVKLIISK